MVHKFSIVHVCALFMLVLNVYTTFQLINGHRGIISYFRANKQYSKNLALMKNLEGQIFNMEARLQLLNNKSLHLKYLEELAISKLNLIQKNDYIIIQNNAQHGTGKQKSA